jgi:RNA polymerase sigma-70 factor (ECF subfamily)
MPTLDQNDILERLRRDDKTALKALFQLHYPSVCQTIHRFITDKNLVEDLAQEVFVRFWEKRQQIQVHSSLAAYLRRMGVNEALAYLRRHKRFDEELTPQITGEATFSAEDQYLHTELEQTVHAAIDTLPPRCRMVFQMSRFEDLTYREIAEQLNISVKTVENQMGKALKLLREQLQGYLHLWGWVLSFGFWACMPKLSVGMFWVTGLIVY